MAALIVAAGRGERVGGEIPKQYMSLLGRPVLRWCIDAMAWAGIEQIVVVIAPEHEDLCHEAIRDGPPVRIVGGGATRTASVRAGLASLGRADIVLVHDAARPGLTPQTVTALVEAIKGGAAGAAPALPIADSLRRADAHGNVVGEVDRDGLMRVQTPQAFRAAALRAAYAALSQDTSLSDDLAVVRANGGACVLIPGDARLMKITYPEDLALMERMLMSERVTCVGTGIDAHRFGPGEYVTLCGVRVAHDKGLVGHS
ncbi:MAG TPA: 2-C-methyl-D-erythritol 4-phosphate cytidylyltransferase, partial [Candidatus Binatia bacterium]|nr:2-C-methyl-D-erythritol 4-phosphate cytidylyltransferase [Candidatus Binatia bacterium]